MAKLLTIPHRDFSPHDSKSETKNGRITVSINMEKRFSLVIRALTKFGNKGIGSAEDLAANLNGKLKKDVYNTNHMLHVLRQLAKVGIVENHGGSWRLTSKGAARYANLELIKRN
jgi:hypothetical protein